MKWNPNFVVVILIVAGALGSLQYQRTKALERQSQCINNLRMIDSNKRQWALEQRKQDTDMPPSLSNLWWYFYGGDWEHSTSQAPFSGLIPSCAPNNRNSFELVAEIYSRSRVGSRLSERRNRA
jgi:hypothetical protein